MKLKTQSGREFEIEFKPISKVLEIARKVSNGIQCTITILDNETTGIGTAYRFHKDVPNLLIGRREAIKSALGMINYVSPMTKQERKEIWDAIWKSGLRKS